MKYKIIASIIATQVTSDLLFEIKATPYYKQGLKNKLNSVLKELDTAFKKEVDKFDEIGEKELTFFYEQLYFLTITLSKIDILDWQKLKRIIEAFEKDKEKMLKTAEDIFGYCECAYPVIRTNVEGGEYCADCGKNIKQ